MEVEGGGGVMWKWNLYTSSGVGAMQRDTSAVEQEG